MSNTACGRAGVAMRREEEEEAEEETHFSLFPHAEEAVLQAGERHGS